MATNRSERPVYASPILWGLVVLAALVGGLLGGPATGVGLLVGGALGVALLVGGLRLAEWAGLYRGRRGKLDPWQK